MSSFWECSTDPWVPVEASCSLRTLTSCDELWRVLRGHFDHHTGLSSYTNVLWNLNPFTVLSSCAWVFTWLLPWVPWAAGNNCTAKTQNPLTPHVQSPPPQLYPCLNHSFFFWLISVIEFNVGRPDFAENRYSVWRYTSNGKNVNNKRISEKIGKTKLLVTIFNRSGLAEAALQTSSSFLELQKEYCVKEKVIALGWQWVTLRS